MSADHQRAYQDALHVRDRLHGETVAEANEHLDAVRGLQAGLRDGRLTPAEARSQLRDIDAARERLLGTHRGIESSEDRLTEMEAVTPAEHHEAMVGRFPALRTSPAPQE